MKEGMRRALFIFVFILVSGLVFENNLAQAQDKGPFTGGCRPLEVGNERPEYFPPPGGYGTPGGSLVKKVRKLEEEKPKKGEEEKEKDPKGKDEEKVDPDNTAENATAGGQRSKRSSLSPGEYQFMRSIELNDEGAMEFNTIQVPPSGALKDNFEVSYSNGQVMFTLPIGINLKGRKGHDIELKLQFNSGIDRPDGKFGNFWNFIPNGFIYFDQLIELGPSDPPTGEENPNGITYICDMMHSVPYLYQFQDGRLSTITNVDAINKEKFFENANADYVYPDETLSGDVGFSTNTTGFLVVSPPKDNHSWIAPNDMVCSGLFKPFVNNNPNEHDEGYIGSYRFSPGASKVLRFTANLGLQVREKNGTIYTYSPFYKRQDKRYDIHEIDLPHQGLPGNPTGDYEYSRSQCRSRLKSVKYPDGDKISYIYDEWDRLVSIRDSLGRHIYFTYDYNNPNRIESISDFEGYPSLCKRTALFTYYESGPNAGLLKEVITPWPTEGLKGGDPLDGIAWKFDYDCVKEPNLNSYKLALSERTYLENFKVWSPSEDMVNDQSYFHAEFSKDWIDYPSSVFHREYRVKHLTCGSDINDVYKAGGTYTYHYTKEVHARITTCELPDLPGAPSQTNAYVFDSQSNLLSEIIDYHGLKLETYYQYRPDSDDPNEDCYPYGLVYKTVYPKGNIVLNHYQYDDYLADLMPFSQRDNFQVGNLLKTEYLNSDEIVMSSYEYTYEPYFNRLCTETDYNGNTRSNYYGFQELDKSISDLVLPNVWGVDDSDFTAGNNFNLGDLNNTNGGGAGDETHMELVRVEEPVVTKGLAGQGPGQTAYTAFQYNDALQLTQKSDAEGRVTRYEYYSDLGDPDGDGLYLVDLEDQATKGGGYLKKVISAPGTNLETFTEYKYNSVGDLLSEIDSYGNRTIYSVNERHQVWKETKGEINEYGNPVGADPAWTESLIYYDIDGNAVEARNRNDNEVTSIHPELLNPGYVTSLYEYDILGKLRKSSRECVYIDHDDGDAVKYKMLSEHFVYDARGKFTHFVSQGGSVVRAKYDNPWNKISEKRKHYESVSMPWDGDIGSLPGNNVEDDVLSFTYDENGNLETMTDAENDIYTIEYDDMDRRTKLIKPTGSTLEHVLDEVGNITSIIESGKFTPDQTAIVELKKKELSYDERNRLYYEKTHYYEIDETGQKIEITTGTHPGFTESQYKLNRVGETVLTKNDNGDGSETDYDLLGRVEREYSPTLTGIAGRNYIHYKYDKMGNVLETIKHEFGFDSDSIEEEITYKTVNEYDGLYRLTKTTKDSKGGSDQVWTYTYDQLGNKITETNPKEVGTKFLYDTFGRMNTQIIGYDSGFTSGVITGGVDNQDQLITKKMGYDNNGNLLYEKDDLGNPTRYQYDSLNRKTWINYADGTSENLCYRTDNLVEDIFAYDDSDPEDLIFTIHSDYTQKRKTSESITIEPGSGLYGNTNISYQYDGMDRIVEVATQSINAAAPDINTTVKRRYDSLDNVVEETQSLLGAAIDEQETVYLEYNGLKSRTKISTTLPTYSVSYAFDELQRISGIDGMGSLGIEQVSRKYQGPGGRITSIDYGNQTQTRVHTDGYDVFGRLTSLTHQSAGNNSARTMICDFAYDYDIGNCRIFELKGHHTNKDNGYQYDLANRLVRYDQGQYDSQTQTIIAPFGDTRTFGLDGVGNFKTHNGVTV